ncbi:flagellar protein FlhE [Pseudomonas cichorii]|nr:flagellar protein FlhE [Pseudomonas cichorii]MBX8540599.1 flagellar protein FlhE [Pseudomonas cichorii]MBX8561011.1 flagellar protein FlhE [Pseudomonas cichorii]MBX8567085.1 flagellar protein FlhE [Pseudomonas cichorii]MBX8570309.1 flagellar protein FlhE [Pseudomonas cichorii]MBX8580322.1 flagellar protein FlhE [Pseudomonas cichorii]
MKRKGILGCAAALVLATVGSNAFAVGGGYAKEANIKPTYSTNQWNTTTIPILGTAPTSGKITFISWKYTIGAIPTNATFNAYLCHGDTNSCIDVTSLKSGSTNFFANRSPSKEFFLYHRISRSTSFAPVTGGPVQVVVNWEN